MPHELGKMVKKRPSDHRPVSRSSQSLHAASGVTAWQPKAAMLLLVDGILSAAGANVPTDARGYRQVVSVLYGVGLCNCQETAPPKTPRAGQSRLQGCYNLTAHRDFRSTEDTIM